MEREAEGSRKGDSGMRESSQPASLDTYHVMEMQGVGWEASCPWETPRVSILDKPVHPGHHPGLFYGPSIAHELTLVSSGVETHRGPRRTLVIAQVQRQQQGD